MVRTRLAQTLAAAAFFIVLGSATALAATAFATTNLNVRKGPGQDYAGIDILRRGEMVDVQRCVSLWCLVAKRGPDGWVSAKYLARDYPLDDYDDYDDYDYEDEFDDYDDDFFFIEQPRQRFFRPRSQVCVGGPNVQFCSFD